MKHLNFQYQLPAARLEALALSVETLALRGEAHEEALRFAIWKEWLDRDRETIMSNVSFFNDYQSFSVKKKKVGEGHYYPMTVIGSFLAAL